ncbi:class I SAM-dependent methyltransferase [Brevibacillus sp. HB1.1]|uniref:TylF/MycF/NovP-related O-methyltransferase n=1 Tax=Brevibacillus sp. HB1.1 TaxID=2738808 RepID=UPI0015752E82|nr:class I SAM-dependent methyltransferase [Brevibacillus sp. HB1.1]
MSRIFEKGYGTTEKKLDNFEKYIRRQIMTRFLARYELFKMQVNIKGNIIECGVHHGGGLMAWAKLSAGLEPYAFDRRIIGFDTFNGFPSIHENDQGSVSSENGEMRLGGLDTGYDVFEELTDVIDEFDQNRFLNQFQKVELVRGDATVTIPQYVKDNPHLLVSLLFLDFDLYEPTKVALEQLLSRMPKGAILAFDEINNPWWPGETQALLEMLDLRKYEINRFSFEPNISYIVL